MHGSVENFDKSVHDSLAVRVKHLMGDDAFCITSFDILIILWCHILHDIESGLYSDSFDEIISAFALVPLANSISFFYVMLIKFFGLVSRPSWFARAAKALIYMVLGASGRSFYAKLIRSTPLPHRVLVALLPFLFFGFLAACRSVGDRPSSSGEHSQPRDTESAAEDDDRR